MTYRWTNPDRLELRPFRSLPPRGFAIVILLFFGLIAVPLVAMLGTAVLWGLLPFALATLAALWVGLRKNYRDAQILETLEFIDDDLFLTRTNPDGSCQDWRCNLHWVRLSDHETGGPVPHYITLNGNGREVEIGAFLSIEERQSLYSDLNKRLSTLR